MKSTKYSNPLHFKESSDFGDPFVYRFNGRYYLFHTGANPEKRVPFYESEDLLEYKYMGEATSDDIMLKCYAPEITYCYNKYYLCGSPSGKGHYIYVSDDVKGPYKRLTGNIHSMIDGSFVVDKDGKLHFIRANHYGLCLMDMDEKGMLSHRRNIDVDMNGWTEGPSIIYKNGYYFLFYTGNNFRTNGYRVCYAYSKDLEGPYREGINNPLLISDSKQHQAFGHSSEVLAPDLLSYLIFFHELEGRIGLESKRRVAMERLHFSKALVSVSPSFSKHLSFRKPTFDSNTDKTVEEDGITFAKKRLGRFYVLEVSMKDKEKAYISYKSKSENTCLEVNGNKIRIINKSENRKRKSEAVQTIETGYNFSKVHTVRIEMKPGNKELFIDNSPVVGLKHMPGGKCGVSDKQHFSFTSLRANSKDDDGIPLGLPSLVSVGQMSGIKKTADYDDFIVGEVRQGESISFKYAAEGRRTYTVSINMKIEGEVTLEINGVRRKIEFIKGEYDYKTYGIGDVLLPKSGKMILKVIEGNISLRYLDFFERKEYSGINNFIQENLELQSNNGQDCYYLSKSSAKGEISVDFKLLKKVPYETFGLLANVRNYSEETCQCRYRFNGILVGFTNNLAVINIYKYNQRRVYDKGFKLEINRPYTLKLKLEDGLIKMFVDGVEIISSEIENNYEGGRIGLYASANANVVFTRFTGGDTT